MRSRISSICAPESGILFQEGALFDSLNVADNVAYPLENQRSLRADGSSSSVATEAKVRESLEFVELAHTLEKFPSELSGGMRRRVGIARAVVTQPVLELYDSPTAGLDPITAHTIITLDPAKSAICAILRRLWSRTASRTGN